jgi:hypothetical protein
METQHMTRQGMTRQCKARHGKAIPGKESHGMAWKDLDLDQIDGLEEEN